MPGLLTFHLVDNNGRQAKTALWVPVTAGAPAVLAFANAVRPRLLAITQNRLLGADYRDRLLGEEPGAAAAGASSLRSATLIYSVGTIADRLVVPSPVPQLAENSGPYAGFRITRASAQAAGLLDELETIVTGTLTESGEAWPGLFEVGSIDERS